MAQNVPQQETFNVPPPNRGETEPSGREEAAVEAEEVANRRRAEEEVLQRNLILEQEFEARKQEAARRMEEVKKQEEAQRLALELEARTQAEKTAQLAAEELARQMDLAQQREQEQAAKRLEEASRIETAQKQKEAIEKEEARRLIALEQEALRRAEEAARQQAADRQKALESQRLAEEQAELARAREIASRQQSEAQNAVRRERELLAAEQAATRAAAGAISGRGPAEAPLAPSTVSGMDLAAKALSQLRSPGAVRTDPPPQPSRPEGTDSSRRRSIFGVERDVMLRMYVDSWRWRIERNGALNYSPSAAWRAYDHPVVTVTIRSDGSLENVLIHRSSGLREIDEAVRRIARLYAPYSAFPPDLARQFDVIEIRRIWNFDGLLRILEETR